MPRAVIAIAHADSSRHSKGVTPACLVSCLFSLAQAGRHRQVIELAGEHPQLLDPNMHAVLAMSHLALGELEAAARSFELARDAAKVVGYAAQPARRAVLDHAIAVLQLARPIPARAVALDALERVRAAEYHDWHWIAVDPMLASLHGDPAFAALLEPRR